MCLSKKTKQIDTRGQSEVWCPSTLMLEVDALENICRVLTHYIHLYFESTFGPEFCLFHCMNTAVLLRGKWWRKKIDGWKRLKLLYFPKKLLGNVSQPLQ